MSGWRPAPNVAWVDAGDFLADDDSIYALVLPDGDPLVLRGPAALVWEAALAGGDLVGDVAAASGTEPAQIAAEVHTFVAELVAQGLLAPAEEDANA